MKLYKVKCFNNNVIENIELIWYLSNNIDLIDALFTLDFIKDKKEAVIGPVIAYNAFTIFINGKMEFIVKL